jgi:hypothetical protein
VKLFPDEEWLFGSIKGLRQTWGFRSSNLRKFYPKTDFVLSARTCRYE